MGYEEMGKREANCCLFASAGIKGKSMSMYALTERSSLMTVGTKGVCNGIASQSAS